jgi:hypothetical protein
MEPICERFDEEVKISIEIMLKQYTEGQIPEENVRLTDAQYGQ